jgi:hypothetical protein
MFSNWTVLTAGLGADNFVDAARRVESQALKGGFERVIRVTEESLVDSCPITIAAYPELFNQSNSGFGFWAYKPEILLQELSNQPLSKGGVIWVDSGCELNLNKITRVRLRWYMLVARVQGATVFTLDTPELHFTKKRVFALFPSINPLSSGKQIQATWFFLSGKRGKAIATRWLEIVLADKTFFDDTFDRSEEHPTFITPRHDQSIFSLVCKEKRIIPMFLPPTSGLGSRKTQFRAHFHPIWASRNRTGKSIIHPRSRVQQS